MPDGNLAEIIQEIAKGIIRNEELYSQLCTVTKIDETERTCEVVPIDDDDDKIFKVKFQSVINSKLGIFIKPKLNTVVIVTFINNNAGFISLVGEIDEILVNCESIVINDGKNGGLINIKSLITQVDKNSAILDAMKIAIEGPPVPEPGNGAPSALQTVLSGATAGKDTADLSDIEDKKVTH